LVHPTLNLIGFIDFSSETMGLFLFEMFAKLPWPDANEMMLQSSNEAITCVTT